MPDLPKPTDTSIATAPSEEANLGSSRTPVRRPRATGTR